MCDGIRIEDVYKCSQSFDHGYFGTGRNGNNENCSRKW